MSRPNLRQRSSGHSGFGITETLVSLSAGVALISASAVALNSTSTLINTSTNKADLRQNSTNGTRLLRAEVERSLNVLIDSDNTPSGLEYTNLKSEDYENTLKSCADIAQGKNIAFNPLFGLKMADLNQPVVYGLSVNTSGKGYSLKRCGSPLMGDGRYSETEDLHIAPVINEIGVMPCWEEIGKKLCNQKERVRRSPKSSDGILTEANLNEIVGQLDLKFKEDKTPIRDYLEPALRVVTDENRKLIRFIDPNANSDDGENSYLQTSAVVGKPTKESLYFAGYARADKRLNRQGESSGVLNGAYFRSVSSKNMNFLVDGSGSMSACILWGTSYGNWRIYWGGSSYYWSRKSCSLTRMESLQHELITLLSDLPDDTKITLQSFSSPGYVNHRSWSESKNGAVVLGDSGVRDSAIAFVNTLDDEQYSYRWGGTHPWEGLDYAFGLDDTDTLYFLSDGEPSINRNGGRWRTSDFNATVQHYSNLNKTRSTELKVNTISLGLQSNWMESLSSNTAGNYLQIDKNYLTASKN